MAAIHVYELGAAAKAMAGLLHLHTNTGMWLISSAYKSEWPALYFRFHVTKPHLLCKTLFNGYPLTKDPNLIAICNPYYPGTQASV